VHCKLIPLRIRVRFRNTQPRLNQFKIFERLLTPSTAMKFRMKFRPKFFWKRSFFDQNQQPLKSIEPFERILRALFMSQCPYKFFSFLDLRNAFNRFRVFSRDTDCFDSFFWDLHAFRLKVLEKNVGGEEGKVGLSISRTNADPQWNPVYNAFHQFFLLWKRNDSSVVLWTWSWCGKPAISVLAGLRKANAER